MIPDNLKTPCFKLKYRLFNGAAIRYYRVLERQQCLSRDELDSLNWEKRTRLLFHAYNRVPYYRQKFNSIGLNPRDIRGPDDYSKVPLLSRDDIRRNFAELLATDAWPGMTSVSTTGGSTGEPLKVLSDKRVPPEAFAWRIREWWGVQLGVNEAVVMRRTLERAWERWINDLIWLPSLRVKLDASSMKPAEISAFIARFNRIRPKIVWGYVGAIFHVASFASDNHLEFVSPQAIWVTAAPLSEVHRRRIEQVFGAPVYDQYGSGEISAIASQCRKRLALHISYDARFVEFTDDAGRPQPVGEYGNVVLTDLENYCFPLIRYVNGDVGRALAGTCPCGINLPLMDKIKGRQSDLIRLADGTCLSGEYLTTIFDDYPDAVKGFQVRQMRDRSIRILYVPNSRCHELSEILAKVHDALLKRTQGQSGIRFEAVESIPSDRGKLRYVISDLGSES